MLLSSFGRQIFRLYETRPLLMNSIVGGTVYFGGEIVVQLINAPDPAHLKNENENEKRASVSDLLQEKLVFFKSVDLKVAGELGALGAVENGVVMLTWYSLLSKYVGSGNSTAVVLLKCFLDQIFFATQQDGIFLGVCAVNHSDRLPDAIKELNANFLTTWINDCSLWPLVNFIGFAYVPLAFQPTYVSMVQFFWQIYISSVASASKSGNNEYASSSDGKEVDEGRILSAFRQIDKDNNGFLDIKELQEAFSLINVSLSKSDLHEMVMNITSAQKILHPPSNSNLVAVSAESRKVNEDDIAISFDDFKYLYQHDKGKFGFLWAALINKISLTKGFKTVMKKLDNIQKHKESSLDEKFSDYTYNRYYEIDYKSIGEVKEVVMKSWREATLAPKSASWQRDRDDSLKHASVGLSFLFVGACIRKIMFKI